MEEVINEEEILKRDYILDFKIMENKKDINIIIKNNTKDILYQDEHIQNILNTYRNKGYRICLYISGINNIHDIFKKMVKNYISTNES